MSPGEKKRIAGKMALNAGEKAVKEFENFSAHNKQDLFNNRKFVFKSRNQKD